MKKQTTIIYCHVILFMLVMLLTGCATDEKETKQNLNDSTSRTEEQKNDDNTQTDEEKESATDASSDALTTDDSAEESKDDSTKETVTNEKQDSKSNHTDENEGLLARYSDEEIEYARIWLQLGPNQQIDELNVMHIPAGTPLDREYFPIVDYPEDVTQLSGSRIADGSVTYSSNGDGTINVYNVPLNGRWYGGFSPPEDIDEAAMREEFEDIITNTRQVYVDPGEDEAVKRLIEIINQ
jgi:major membrane immunogen (membrane-anchored lipoprotein)